MSNDASRSAYVSNAGDGAHDTLSYSAATQQWTWTDGSSRATETYNSSGQLVATVGEQPRFDSTAFATLTAADFSANDQLA